MKSRPKIAAERLYGAAATQSRRESLYARMGVPDTVEGRFELLTLHVILVIDRLREEAAEAKAVRQMLFDVYLSNLDGALREMGVGDLSVGKRMRKLGEAFYGRARASEAAFNAMPDVQPLKEMLRRTVFIGDSSPDPTALANYLQRCRQSLAAAPLNAIILGEPPWAET